MRPLALALLAFAAAGSAAQPSWRPPVVDGPAVSADGLLLLNPASFTLISAASLSARVSAGPVAAVAELPVGYVKAETEQDLSFETTTMSDAGLGNPYLGIETRRGPFVLAMGGRIAVAEREPTTRGFAREPADVASAGIASPADQYLAYMASFASAQALLGVDLSFSPTPRLRALRLRAQGGPAYAHYTGPVADASFARGNLGAVGAAYVDAELAALTLTGGLLGRYDPPAGSLIWTDDLRAEVLIGATTRASSLRPSAYLRLPVAGFYGGDAVVGLGLDVLL